MKKHPPSARLARITALLTFLIATIIFAAYYFTGDLGYGFLGYFFLIFAVIANFIILFIIKLKPHEDQYFIKINRSVGLMFLNVPIAILYMIAGLYLTGVIRITLENNTGQDIQHISIIGCEQKQFELLENGESETVWIDINGDCAISMSYEDGNGNTQEEILVGYATGGMGGPLRHTIGHGETRY